MTHAKSKERADQIAGLLQETTLTLSQIGKRFGVGRERVRQIGVAAGLGMHGRALSIKASKPEKPKKTPWIASDGLMHKARFIACVRRIMGSSGYGYCCSCHRAMRLETMETTSSNRFPQRCKRCAADYRINSYRTEGGKQYARNYAKTERGKEVQASAALRYRLRRTEPTVLSRSIVELRRQLNETQTVFGRTIGVTQNLVSLWETTGIPPGQAKRAKLAAIAKELNCPELAKVFDATVATPTLGGAA